MKQEKIYQIKDMPFPSQVQKVLDKHHIWSSYTLCQMTYEQVASLDGILPAYMLDIERVLNQYGFVLAGYVTQGEVSDEESDMSFDDTEFYDWDSIDLLDWDELDDLVQQEQQEFEDDPDARSLSLKISPHVSKFAYPENLLHDLFDGKYIKSKDTTWEDIASGIACAISSIKPQQIENVLLLRYKYSLTIETIARFYNCSSSNVSLLIHKGLRMLRHPSRYNIFKKGLKHYFQSQKVAAAEEINVNAYQQGYGQAAAEVYNELAPKLDMPIEDLNLSTRTYHAIRRAGINNVFSLLLGYTKLMNGTIRIRNLSRLGIKEVEEKLQQVFPNWQPSHNLSYSEYRTVNSIEKPSIMPVSLKLPEYSSYTNNTAGFHLFITVENNGLELIDIVLHEFFVYHNSRQWMYTSGLSGYGQNEASIHPKCAKTFAKIWSGTDWKEEKLTNGDYAFFSFYCNKKEYAYKFFLNENGWVSEYTHCSPQKEA